MSYEDILSKKVVKFKEYGFWLEPYLLNRVLFPFQRDIVLWALRLGSAAVFADCGLGKTLILSEWARIVNEKTGKPVLIASPLGVSGQTIDMAKDLLGIDIVYKRSQFELSGNESIVITNYEMLDKFHASHFGGLVLDESSILKNYTGKTKQLLLKIAREIPYRLALTATPAPNDHLELGNHAEFLGIMKSRQMIQRWFVNDAMNAGGYRLREHGREDFWRWVSSWAVSLQKPSDIGNYLDDGYILPDLDFIGHVVGVDHTRAWNEVGKDGQMSLLLVGNTSATGMYKEKRATMKDRMNLAANIVTDEMAKYPDESVIIWVETNDEADYIKKILPSAIEVRGSEPLDQKQDKLLSFGRGEYKIIVTKTKIAAHGLNWQHAGIQVWPSITHKFEAFYQGYKRSHRFGRKDAVRCHIIYAESEGSILSNLERKHKEHVLMQREMVRAMRENGMSLRVDRPLVLSGQYNEFESGAGWKLYHGDSAITLRNEPSASVDFIVQSPPFKSLYIYSSNLEDLGNCETDSQFYDQYKYILEQEYRIAKPGSYKCEHCKDLPLYKNRDDAMGLQNFPGELIAAHLDIGWKFVGWITVWKDPVVEMQRTKNAGLIWSSAFCERGERCRQGMADYVLVFQKTDNEPFTFSKKNLLPSTIARCIDLWSNSGETVELPGQEIDGIVDLAFSDDIPTTEQLRDYSMRIRPGRNLVVNINNPLDMAGLIRDAMQYGLVFHSRVALTNDTWLLVLRNWSNYEDDENTIHVIHDLDSYSHTFIGNDSPKYYDSHRDYSIQVWQRYASPVWFDLDGLPPENDNIWFDIDQTNVLNHKMATENADEKHICPLQLDLIEKCVLRYTKKGDLVHSSFAGVGSELVTSLKLGRRAIGSELKRSYYEYAIKHIREVVNEIEMPRFNFWHIEEYDNLTNT